MTFNKPFDIQGQIHRNRQLLTGPSCRPTAFQLYARSHDRREPSSFSVPVLTFCMKVTDMDGCQGSTTSTLSDEAFDISPEAFAVIMKVLKEVRGFNLEIYKEKCIKRRIAIRIRRTNFTSAIEYGAYLKHDDAEADHLLKVLTIHVSQFYRNRPTFDKLRDDIIPRLFTQCDHHNYEGLRIWSVGCAGGEEPYSLALILTGHFSRHLSEKQVSILATDVDAEIIEAAKEGSFREERLIEVSAEEMERWFVQLDGKFKLAQQIKDMVTFRQSDLSDVTAFPECDLILCRNVLIYLERSHQEKVLNAFADALRPGGMLVLGKAETLIGESRRRFRTVCPIERIYQVVGQDETG